MEDPNRARLIFPPKMKRGLRADRTPGGRRGRLTGTIRIYLYSSWLEYCNDALLQNLPSL